MTGMYMMMRYALYSSKVLLFLEIFRHLLWKQHSKYIENEQRRRTASISFSVSDY
jgi:hypothetical protein